MRILWLLLSMALTPPLAAQDGMPRRPKLPRDADTNDARAYVAYGDLDQTPWSKSHDAYYWAWRLEPNQTSYLYARWQALYFQQPAGWRLEYGKGANYVLKSKEAKLIDSLYPEILQRDPFPTLQTPCVFPELVDSRDHVIAGLDFYYRGCYRQSAERLQAALAKDPSLLGLRLQRARALYYAQQYRGAAAEVQIVLDSLRARDEKHLGPWYNTKEALEHMVAAALLRARDIPAARAALGRALTENLSYHPAHALLSRIAMDQGDIPAALQEAELAVGLREGDGALRFNYATLLTRAGKLAEAEVQLAKAVELEPYWAEARWLLAWVLDKQDKRPEAVSAYREFLARAPKRENVRIKEAEERIAALQAGS